MNQTLVVFLILFTISISSILFLFVAFSPNSTGSSLVSYYPALSVTPATAERLGAIYYDGSYLKCYENGVWKNCISGESGGSGGGNNVGITWTDLTNVLPWADENVADNITVNWSGLTGFPGGCPSGQYVTAVSNTLTCSTPTINSIPWNSITDFPSACTGSQVVKGVGTNLTCTALTTSDIAEGTNLYFTNTRAQQAMTGAISTVTTSNLTANRAVVSDSSGKISASTVTSTEIGYLSGVTGNIQTQLNTMSSDISDINDRLNQISPGSSNPLIVVKTADEVVYNSTTLQNDDHLFFDVGANEVWFVEWHIRLLSGTTPDWKWAVTAPSGTTCYSYNWGQIGALTAAGTIAGTACGTAISVDGTGASALFVGFSRIITGSTAGRVQLQWAQNTANASNTIVYANSYLIAHKIK